VFALIESWDAGGNVAAGWNSPLLEPTPLPAGTKAAVPDGRGGIVSVTEEQVWWLSEPSAVAKVIEQPGISVNLVGLRYVAEEPEVLVLIGQKLIGYDRGGGELRYLFDGIGGDVVDIDVDGDLAVLVVATDGSRSVYLVTLSTGDIVELAAAVPAGDPPTPTLATVSGDNVVVMFGTEPGQLYGIDGSPKGSVDLRVEDMGVTSVDLVDGQLIAVFGEAALAIDIDTGERYVVDTPDGWLVAAVWGAAPEPPPPDAVAIDRYRVNTAMVEADASDPYLNVRWGPGVSHELLAKLPATYTGLRWTGEEEPTDDGALWYQVTLLDPIATTTPEPLEGRSPVGWVNSAFLEHLPDGLPVTTDEVPACVDELSDIAASTGNRPISGVYALESAFLSERCLRIVLTFGSGEIPFSWDTPTDIAPADSIPQVYQSGFSFPLGDIDSVWVGATETSDNAYIVASGDALELWALHWVQRATLQAVPDRGIVVVDLLLNEAQPTMPSAGDVVLTSEPIAGSGAVAASGIARPHEGQLGVRIADSSGELVPAVYSGSLVVGTVETSKYVVEIPDRYPAWQPFAIRAERLAAGEYTLFLDAGGGGDTWQPLRWPMSLDEHDLSGMPDWLVDSWAVATESDQTIVRSLVAFARGEAPSSTVRLAGEVTLGLNVVEFRVRNSAELTEHGAWDINVEEFDGITGRLSALDALAHHDFVRVSAGSIPHCAGPPLQWPAEFGQWRQINVEPIGIESCLQWSGVSIFLNAHDEIAAVVVDYFGP